MSTTTHESLMEVAANASKEGAEAYRAGKGIDKNPYDPDWLPISHSGWERGFTLERGYFEVT